MLEWAENGKREMITTIEQKQGYKKRRDTIFWAIFFPLSIAERIVVYSLNQSANLSETAAWILNICVIIVMFGLLITVCYYWAKYKGRNRWFMLLGIIGFFGFIPLCIMKDKNVIRDEQNDDSTVVHSETADREKKEPQQEIEQGEDTLRLEAKTKRNKSIIQRIPISVLVVAIIILITAFGYLLHGLLTSQSASNSQIASMPIPTSIVPTYASPSLTQSPALTPAPNPAPTPTTTLRPKPNITLPAGKSAFYGRVMWGDKPVVNGIVISDNLTPALQGLGKESKRFTTNTDNNGDYVLIVEPDKYYLGCTLPGSDYVTYKSFGLGLVGVLGKEIKEGDFVFADLEVSDWSINLISPPNGATVNSTPTLSWQGYNWPKYSTEQGYHGYYRISVIELSSNMMFPNIVEEGSSNETSYSISNPLQKGGYLWNVSVYSASGKEIANTISSSIYSTEGFTFTVQ